VSSLVIQAASIFEMKCGKPTNTQTNEEKPYPATAVGVGNHRLHGSASPVLTATGFVNGKGQFSIPTESTPLNRSPKKLSQVIMSATPTAVPN